MRHLVLLGLAAALSASACQSVSSSNLNTNQIAATFSVTAANTGETSVEAALAEGSNTVTLASSDSLTVAVSGVSATALSANSSLLGETDYTATLDTNLLGPYTLAYTHKGWVTDSTVTLPPAFTLETPVSGATYSASSSAIPLSWSALPATNETMNWSASGSCITAISNEQIGIEAGDDQTAFSIPAGTLTMTSSSSTTGTTTPSTGCAVTITVAGELAGTMDSSVDAGMGSDAGEPGSDADFASGSTIYGIQSQSVTINVTP